MVDKQQLTAMGEHAREMEERKPEFKVPDGWKLVPVEPTREMVASCDVRFIPSIALPVFVAAYKTMLAAAPEYKP